MIAPAMQVGSASSAESVGLACLSTWQVECQRLFCQARLPLTLHQACILAPIAPACTHPSVGSMLVRVGWCTAGSAITAIHISA